MSEDIIETIQKFKSHCRKFELLKKTVTKEVIKSYFNGDKTETFYEYYEKRVNQRKGTLKPDSYRIYMTTLRMLKEFRSEVQFSEVDKNFILDFENYLRIERGNNDGGLFNKHKNLRYVIRQAIEDGFVDKNPYHNFKLPRPSERIIALEQDEITKLEKLQRLNLKPALKLSLEAFLFSCYTGFRFSDVISLETKHIDFDKRWLKKAQVKTGREVEMRLCDKAYKIVRKHYDENREMIFPKISNPKVNLHLKKLMKLSSVSKHLTYHISRHTFATFLSTNGVGIEHISRLMGHASIKETMKYAKPAKAIMNSAIDKFDF